MYSLVVVMAEKSAKYDSRYCQVPEPAFEPEIGRDLCRVERKNHSKCEFPREEKNYGGYKKDILTENLTEREKAGFICKVCEGIMKDTFISSSGEQFCSCCRYSLSKETPDVSVRKMISSLKCCCPLIERGCKWLGSLESCENHLDTCGYVYEACELTCGAVLRREELRIHEKRCPKMKVSCDFACGEVLCREDMEQHLMRNCGTMREKCRLGCGVVLIRNGLKIHEKKCPQRVVKCEHCMKDFKSCELNEHLEKCPKMKITCSLCHTQIIREDMEQHFDYDCGTVKEKCSLGCGAVLTRNDLKIHVTNICIERKIRCQHCHINVKVCSNPKHLKECPYVKITCELCKVEKYRKDMTNHIEQYCPEKIFDCPFAKYKCTSRMKRKDMDKHLEEMEIKHLELKITAMESLITNQSEKIDKLDEIIRRQSSVINEQNYETNKQKEEIKKQKEEIDQQKEEINEHCWERIQERDELKEVIEKQNEEMTIEKANTSQYIEFLYSITDTLKMTWKIENLMKPINESKDYHVAGYTFRFHFQLDSMSIVFPKTTIKHIKPFVAKINIVLLSRRIGSGTVDVKQRDLVKGCERMITHFSEDDFGKMRGSLTLDIYLTIQ